MKTLNLHVDYIEWEGLKKALSSMEDLPEVETAKTKVEEALVVMTAIEKNDSMNMIDEYLENIETINAQVGAKNVVLYPYAHLSSELGKPALAIEFLKTAEEKLKAKGISVYRAPFGYYKSFELKVKGHPLSELSRNIVGNEEVEVELTDKERKKLLKEVSKSKLDTSKLVENDHRIIGKKMDLWSFSAAAPGMVFWHDKGLHIKNKLIEYWREMHRNAGYQEISTPQIMDKKLWEVSGHWAKYKDNMFTSKYERRDFAMKPMNCPGGMMVYKTSPKSYKDLPLRSGELGVVHRQELSGVLSGLFRVIQFTQDDAHIFCTEEQLEVEIGRIIDLINEAFATFNLTVDHVELSTRPEKRIGREELWDLAEKSLQNVLDNRKMTYTINEGDGAFYGPKIDFHLKDSLNRTWQCSTIQLDMALPERFDLEYTAEDGIVKRPIMLHRVIYGSIERFIGIITEQYNGNFPLWINPNQIKVMTLNENTKDYAKEVYDKLFAAGFRIELDDRDEKIGYKIREASISRFNYMLTLGDSEKEEGMVAVKKNGEKEIEKMSLEDFVEKMKVEIESKK
ncbi:MAG: threonine--tRNA ligase [Nanoarchaeota archaeon]|jgi:threonyl-tRNA synthetase|nr:threonine--tRNA ligase [Nanoarchaeota archaeon]